MKYYYFFLLLLIGFNSFGQAKSGTVIIEGGFNYNKSTSKFDSSPTENLGKIIRFNPKLSLYLSDKNMVGVNFDYIQFSEIFEEQFTFNNTVETWTFSATENLYRYGLFFSRQLPINEKLCFRTDFGAHLARIEGKVFTSQASQPNLSSGTYRYEGEGYGGYIQPGLMYFLTKGIAISGTFGGLYIENIDIVTDQGENANFNQVGFNFDPSRFLFSVTFIFPEKHSAE